MGDYRSKPYVDDRRQIDSYYDTSRPTPSNFHDMRSYSVPYAPTYMGNNKDLKLKKGKSQSGTSSKSWTFSDPEFQRKKRVASYKAYSVEGKVKGSLRNSFRWLKARYHRIVYGWS